MKFYTEHFAQLDTYKAFPWNIRYLGKNFCNQIISNNNKLIN